MNQKYDFVCSNGILLEVELNKPPGPVHELPTGKIGKLVKFKREERSFLDKTWYVYRQVEEK